jgi:hypothetical protein
MGTDLGILTPLFVLFFNAFRTICTDLFLRLVQRVLLHFDGNHL